MTEIEPVNGVPARGHKGFAIAAVVILLVLGCTSILPGGRMMAANGWLPPAPDAGHHWKGLMPREWWYVGVMRLVSGLLQAAIAALVWLRLPRPPIWTIIATLAWGAWAWTARLFVRTTRGGGEPPTESDFAYVFLNHWGWGLHPGDLLLPLCGVLLAVARWRPRPPRLLDESEFR